MWLLSGLYAPSVDVAGPLQGYMSARCESYERMTSLRDAPATLPASAYVQAREAISYASNDGAAPEYVRATARCWAGVVNAATNSANNAGTDGSDRDVPRDLPREDRTVIVETSAPRIDVHRQFARRGNNPMVDGLKNRFARSSRQAQHE